MRFTTIPQSCCRLLVALALLFLGAPDRPSGAETEAGTKHSPYVWNFDALPTGTLPKDFVIGTLFDGRPAGEWKVLQTDRAKSSPQVLAQVMGKGAEHAYKVVLVDGTTASDLDLQVSFLSIAGKADMGGGLVWRAADDRNYYLTRANPLEQNIQIGRASCRERV